MTLPATTNVRIVLFKGPGSFVDTLIRWWTQSPYSHCELVFTDGTWFSTDTAEPQHVRLLPPEQTPATLDPVAFLANYDVIRIPMSEANEAKMRTWATSVVGAAYDWAGIYFSQVLNLGWHTATRYFCGEVDTEALEVGGVPFTLQPQRYNPGRLAKTLRALYPQSTP
jgi:hypothetical protein